ncbi:hypothetical protein BH10PSE13_BH10PSE13_16190 [soil metagenome]
MQDIGVTAVLALLIGIIAGMESPMEAPVEAPLAPALNGAPGDRGSERRGNGNGRASDAETVAAMPPGVGSVTIERRIIIRIPTLRAPATDLRQFAPRASAAPQSGAARRPTCLSLDIIRGATMHDRAGILFVTNGNIRYQAVLERGCRPVDFQSGFYLGATEDGAICAGRDMLHARSGLRCAIVGLKRLAPEM